MKYSMTDQGMADTVKMLSEYKSNNVMKATLIALLDGRRSGDVNEAIAAAVADMPKAIQPEYRKAIAVAILVTAETKGLIN